MFDFDSVRPASLCFCSQVCAVISLLPSCSLADLTCDALLMLSGNVSCKSTTNIGQVFHRDTVTSLFLKKGVSLWGWIYLLVSRFFTTKCPIFSLWILEWLLLSFCADNYCNSWLWNTLKCTNGRKVLLLVPGKTHFNWLIMLFSVLLLCCRITLTADGAELLNCIYRIKFRVGLRPTIIFIHYQYYVLLIGLMSLNVSVLPKQQFKPPKTFSLRKKRNRNQIKQYEGLMDYLNSCNSS